MKKKKEKGEKREEMKVCFEISFKRERGEKKGNKSGKI